MMIKKMLNWIGYKEPLGPIGNYKTISGEIFPKDAQESQNEYLTSTRIHQYHFTYVLISHPTKRYREQEKTELWSIIKE